MTLQSQRARRAARFAAAAGFALGLAATAASAQMARGGGGDGELRAACASDVQTLCPGIQPGGGKLKACLKENSAKVSMGCKKALVEAKRAKAAGQGATGTQGAPSTP